MLDSQRNVAVFVIAGDIREDSIDNVRHISRCTASWRHEGGLSWWHAARIPTQQILAA